MNNIAIFSVVEYCVAKLRNAVLCLVGQYSRMDTLSIGSRDPVASPTGCM